MVLLDPTLFRFLEKRDFRVLAAIERGMQTHEIVPVEVIARNAKLAQGTCMHHIRTLHRSKLVWHTSAPYNGYRLTCGGYDYLALHTLVQRGTVSAIAHKIGVGKEADIYEATNAQGEALVIKFHRLGRTSFRAVRKKRDYVGKHKNINNWLFLSRLSAEKEYAVMQALWARDFHIPRPYDANRHCVVMQKIDGTLLASVKAAADPQKILFQALDFAVQLAELGIVHCDLNEFNLLVEDDERLVLIDFPQVVSVRNAEAAQLFDRDITCLLDFFDRKFGVLLEKRPLLADIKQIDSVDKDVAASGYNTKQDALLKEARDEFLNDSSDEPDDDEDHDAEHDNDDEPRQDDSDEAQDTADSDD